METLPLHRSPVELRGLIVRPAFASEGTAYAGYMAQHAADLFTFVDGAAGLRRCWNGVRVTKLMLG